jgi:hypothetical protein
MRSPTYTTSVNIFIVKYLVLHPRQKIPEIMFRGILLFYRGQNI